MPTLLLNSYKMVVDPPNKYKLYHTHLDVLKLIVKTPKNEGIFRSKFSLLKCFDDIAESYYVRKESAKGAPNDSISNNINDKNEKSSEQFKCSQCGLWFNTEDELTNHQTCACKENKYVCDQCSLRFKSKGKLQQHKKRHKKPKGTHSGNSKESDLQELDYQQVKTSVGNLTCS